jgi:hypothetical protein
MTDPKTRFQKVSLEDLKKILPEQVADGNHNHRGNQKDKKKNKPQAAKTSKPKSRA